MPVGPSTRFILAIALQSASKGKYVLFAHRLRVQDGESPTFNAQTYFEMAAGHGNKEAEKQAAACGRLAELLLKQGH